MSCQRVNHNLRFSQVTWIDEFNRFVQSIVEFWFELIVKLSGFDSHQILILTELRQRNFLKFFCRMFRTHYCRRQSKNYSIWTLNVLFMKIASSTRKNLLKVFHGKKWFFFVAINRFCSGHIKLWFWKRMLSWKILVSPNSSLLLRFVANNVTRNSSVAHG